MTPFLFFLCLCIVIQFGAMGLMLYETLSLAKENKQLRIDRAAVMALYDAVTYHRNTGK